MWEQIFIASKYMKFETELEADEAVGCYGNVVLSHFVVASLNLHRSETGVLCTTRFNADAFNLT